MVWPKSLRELLQLGIEINVLRVPFEVIREFCPIVLIETLTKVRAGSRLDGKQPHTPVGVELEFWIAGSG